MRPRPSQLAIVGAFLLVLALPFIVSAMSGRQAGAGLGTRGQPGAELIIVTPHVEQIRLEFASAFSRWHLRHFGSDVRIDWRQPGGTSEIIKQLEASFDAAARNGEIGSDGACRPGKIGFDVFFGGGSYEHSRMKAPRTFAGSSSAPKFTYAMGRPAGFDQARLDEWFGENLIGQQTLYDPDQYWIGTALSGFGIVYNRDALRERGLSEPRGFADLCDARYANMLALADPRQSGSITTTFESIMNKEGWDGGWRILRELSANARYFASAATKVPVDVSQGEAAAGLSIDFYGRGQAQFTMKPGQTAAESRVGYVDPDGAVYIDADPVTILNGCSDFPLARRFVEFCLTEEAQALWQFRSINTEAGSGNPVGEDGRPMGPTRTELRRMPVRRVMYAKYLSSFVDQSNPFELASKVPGRGWRGAISPIMAAFGIDVSADLRAAWDSLNRARDAAGRGAFSPEVLQQMEAAFYAMPVHTFKDGAALPFNERNFKAIYADADKFKDTEHAKRTQIRYAEFFRSRYREVIRLGRSRDVAGAS
ncbi:MAG: extracellular solute-binding protein [Phycisphaerales bacterium]|nr:extracellular solute-binding protein [Phycisphaerales bacterium]